MNWNEWEFVWKRQDLPVGAGADVAKLMETFEAAHRRMARVLLVRDLTEASAGVLVSGVFAFTAWRMGRAGWPIAIVVALCLGVTGVFLWERVKARRTRTGPGAALLEKVEADLAELRHQRSLLTNVAWWYLAPLFLACMIVMATVTARTPHGSLQRAPLFMAGMILFFLALYVGVWVINRRAVTKQLDPRLAELDKLRREILSP